MKASNKRCSKLWYKLVKYDKAISITCCFIVVIGYVLVYYEFYIVCIPIIIILIAVCILQAVAESKVKNDLFI